MFARSKAREELAELSVSAVGGRLGVAITTAAIPTGVRKRVNRAG